MRRRRLKKKKDDQRKRRGRIGNWSQEEDNRLMKLVKKYGARKWSKISNKMESHRNGKQCRERWFNHLSPDVVAPNDLWWSAEEEKLIIEYHEKLGNKWSKIAGILKNENNVGRSANAIKNHYNSTIKRIVEEKREELANSMSNTNGYVEVELEFPDHGQDESRGMKVNAEIFIKSIVEKNKKKQKGEWKIEKRVTRSQTRSFPKGIPPLQSPNPKKKLRKVESDEEDESEYENDEEDYKDVDIEIDLGSDTGDDDLDDDLNDDDDFNNDLINSIPKMVTRSSSKMELHKKETKKKETKIIKTVKATKVVRTNKREPPKKRKVTIIERRDRFNQPTAIAEEDQLEREQIWGFRKEVHRVVFGKRIRSPLQKLKDEPPRKSIKMSLKYILN